MYEILTKFYPERSIEIDDTKANKKRDTSGLYVARVSAANLSKIYHHSEYQSWIGKSLLSSFLYEHIDLKCGHGLIVETKHFEHFIARFMQIDRIEPTVIFLLKAQR